MKKREFIKFILTTFSSLFLFPKSLYAKVEKKIINKLLTDEQKKNNV